MMQDITKDIVRFRETARHIWNIAFLHSSNWDVRDESDSICRELFGAMVLRPIEMQAHRLPLSSEATPTPLMFLKVVPNVERGTPIMINRESGSQGCWDHQIDTADRNDVDLRFVRFFDWDELGVRDFAYLLVVIESFRGHAELKGRFALVEARDAQVMNMPASASRRPVESKHPTGTAKKRR